MTEARIGAEMQATQWRGELARAGDNPVVRPSDN